MTGATLARQIPSVAITIVTFNSDRFIGRCLEHLFELDYPHFEVILIDNASDDGTREILRSFSHRAIIVYNTVNNGFAGGQNQAMRLANSDWILTLNPDVRLTRDFLSVLVNTGEFDPQVGTVCGKLLGMSEDFGIPAQPRIDSTGIFFTPNLRHLDRGSQQPDLGQYFQDEYVFGATGAAALFRRTMIEDIAIAGEFFDEQFFAYREDADVAWRAQWRGWKCIYTPRALAYHVRNVLPANRRLLPSEINMHSVKNRFLMRIKNSTWGLYREFALPMTKRDFLVIAACFVREFRSLRAFWLVLRHLPETLRKRREIMRKRRSTDAFIVSWFSYDPVSFPVCHLESRTDSGEAAASR